jgi:hypothetical protein
LLLFNFEKQKPIVPSPIQLRRTETLNHRRPEDTRSLVPSFLDVYPHASLWTTELHEMLLVGSIEPLDLDVPRISERFNQPEVAAALREVGIASPEALLAKPVIVVFMHGLAVVIAVG